MDPTLLATCAKKALAGVMDFYAQHHGGSPCVRGGYLEDTLARARRFEMKFGSGSKKFVDGMER